MWIIYYRPTVLYFQGHGISAASGKLGAFIASLATPHLYAAYGMPVVLGVFGGFMALGFICTWFIPETKFKTLESLTEEDESMNKRETTRI